jgi:parallel beta-helix repeat protein
MEDGMNKAFTEGKPSCNGLYIVEESGDRNSMRWTPEYIHIDKTYPEPYMHERFDIPYEVRSYGYEATYGAITLYDSKTNRVSDTTIYKNDKGFYIKKSGRKYYLGNFTVGDN